jgi:hypothetical protein
LRSRGESDRIVYVAIMREDTSKLDEKLEDNNWGTWDAQFRGLAYCKGIIATDVAPGTLITVTWLPAMPPRRLCGLRDCFEINEA